MPQPLIDKLMYPLSRPIASRVVGRSHFEGLKLKDVEGYLIAGAKEKTYVVYAEHVRFASTEII